MNSNFFVIGSFILLGLCLLLQGTSGRLVDRKYRQVGKQGKEQDVTKVLSPKDLHHIENAVKAELKDNTLDIKSLTPEKLDQLVEEHSQNLPWYKRLYRRFKDALPDIITAVAKKILDEVVLPAITKQLNAAG